MFIIWCISTVPWLTSSLSPILRHLYLSINVFLCCIQRKKKYIIITLLITLTKFILLWESSRRLMIAINIDIFSKKRLTHFFRLLSRLSHFTKTRTQSVSMLVTLVQWLFFTQNLVRESCFTHSSIEFLHLYTLPFYNALQVITQPLPKLPSYPIYSK